MKLKYYQAEVKRPELKKGTLFSLYIIRAKSEDDAKRFLQQEIKFSSATVSELDIEKRIIFFFNELKKRNFNDNEFYPFYKKGYDNLIQIRNLISPMRYGDVYHLVKDEQGNYYNETKKKTKNYS